jgi:hypothetical protein
MQPPAPDHSPTDATSSWGIHGDPALLAEAARRLRRAVEMSVYRPYLLPAIPSEIDRDGPR